MELRKNIDSIRSQLDKLKPDRHWRDVCERIYKEAMQAVNRLEWLEFRYEGRDLPKANTNHPEFIDEEMGAIPQARRAVPRRAVPRLRPAPNFAVAGGAGMMPLDPFAQPPAPEVEPEAPGDEPQKPDHLRNMDYDEMDEDQQEEYDSWDRRWMEWNDRSVLWTAWNDRRLARQRELDANQFLERDVWNNVAVVNTDPFNLDIAMQNPPRPPRGAR